MADPRRHPIHYRSPGALVRRRLIPKWLADWLVPILVLFAVLIVGSVVLYLLLRGLMELFPAIKLKFPVIIGNI